MKKLLKHVDAALTDSRFPVNLLACIAIVSSPQALSLPVLMAIVGATIYKQWRTEPESLNDPQWWRHPSWQRLGTYGIIGIFFFLIRAAMDANLFTCSLSDIFRTLFCTGPGLASIFILSVFSLTCLRAVKTWPAGSLGLQLREHQRRLQGWTSKTYASFMASYLCLVTAIAFVPDGLGTYLANWLLASGRDAKLEGIDAFCRAHINVGGTMNAPLLQYVAAEANSFEFWIKIALAVVVAVCFWTRATKLAGLLTTFCKRLCGRLHGHNLIDVMLRTMKEPRSKLKLRSRHAFLNNVVASLGWLIACYLILLVLFGFSGGPLGHTISNWMDACLADARTGMVYGAKANPHLRIFCAAIVALYGTVPFAVMGCIFMPYMKARELVLNDEGMLLPGSVFHGMRLWSDFAHIDVRRRGKAKGHKNSSLLIRFHSGGKMELGVLQLRKTDLEKFLSLIDEHASECVVTEAVVALRVDLRQELGISAAKENELGALSPQAFQSTIFVPHEPGSWLPNGESRVVRLLASRPLACVYLVRMESGKLAIAKQFFLAEDDEQTQALKKCFEREYELLSTIDHEAVSKVLGVFHKEQSTYLLVEHADGVDLRSLISEGGPQSEKLVFDWALQLCDIMQYLHSQDPPIIHRDLTPDNVIVSDNGSLRVIDFGAAHQFLEGITGTIIGKQCYVSPEQLRGHAGTRSDIYSFGCMLYFLLTGVEPVALVQCVPSSKSDISEELNALVQECTDFDEQKRPSSFAEIKERLLSIQKLGTTVLDLCQLKEKILVK